MPMRNSRMTDEWIARVIHDNPCRIHPVNGNIITCPLRLKFVFLDEPRKPDPKDPASIGKTPVYSVTGLLPPGSDPQVWATMWPPVVDLARQKFPQYFDPQGNMVGLKHPIHNQIDKTVGVKTYTGFTPGCLFFNAASQRKPSVTDIANNPIVDRNRMYPGVWAILSLNVYPFSKLAKGISYGLQGVMLLQDDEVCEDGPVFDAKSEFAGVKIDASYAPAAAFGAAPPPGGYAPPAGVMPAAAPVYAPPGGYAPPPGGYAPPVAPGYAPPAPAYAPPVAPGYAAPAPAWQPPVAPADDGSDYI